MVMGAGPRAASVTLVGSRARARTPEAAGITCRYAPVAGGGERRIINVGRRGIIPATNR